MVGLSPDGGRIPRASDEDILDVFRTAEESGDSVLSTAEVADALPIKRRATYNRLMSLKDEGQLESKKIGARNRVWWLAED